MSRYRFPFWLDTNKDEERLLMELIGELKRKRRFAKVVRDGIRLVVDLREGRIEVLTELFPWITERLSNAPVKVTENNDRLHREIADLKKVILEQRTVPEDAPLVAAPVLKSVQKAQTPAPADLPTLKVSKARGDSSAASNFLHSIVGLQR